MKSSHIFRLLSLLLCLSLLFGVSNLPGVSASEPQEVTGATYYVSSSLGNDAQRRPIRSEAFATIAKVNALNLQPGDRVLFKCGDMWRAEQLILSKSGTQPPRSSLARTPRAAPTNRSSPARVRSAAGC